MSDTKALIERLLSRRNFMSTDCVRWYMTATPDGDCAEAADTIARLEAERDAARRCAQPLLTVRLGSFPESNGKRNWTAMFVRTTPWGGLIGNCGGITIARGEMWNRVAYEAECARALLGERDTEPHILDYGDDIPTPEEWAGEVRGGRFLRPNVAIEPRR